MWRPHEKGIITPVWLIYIILYSMSTFEPLLCTRDSSDQRYKEIRKSPSLLNLHWRALRDEGSGDTQKQMKRNNLTEKLRHGKFLSNPTQGHTAKKLQRLQLWRLVLWLFLLKSLSLRRHAVWAKWSPNELTVLHVNSPFCDQERWLRPLAKIRSLLHLGLWNTFNYLAPLSGELMFNT